MDGSCHMYAIPEAGFGAEYILVGANAGVFDQLTQADSV